MELKEIYEQIGGSYEDVVGRLVKEDRIIKYLKLFAATPTVENITAALEQEDYTAAFREAHNMKGVCANLGLTDLYQPASELTEALRGGCPTVDIAPMLEKLKISYERALSVIQTL